MHFDTPKFKRRSDKNTIKYCSCILAGFNVCDCVSTFFSPLYSSFIRLSPSIFSLKKCFVFLIKTCNYHTFGVAINFIKKKKNLAPFCSGAWPHHNIWGTEYILQGIIILLKHANSNFHHYRLIYNTYPQLTARNYSCIGAIGRCVQMNRNR